MTLICKDQLKRRIYFLKHLIKPMANKYLIVYSFLALAISVSSCVTNKQFYRDFKKAALQSREPGKDVFIENYKGERVEGSILTHSHWSEWKKVQKEDWDAVDGHKVDRKDINIIQTKESYSVYIQHDEQDKKGYFTKLSILVERIRVGKIDLFDYEHAANEAGPKQRDVRGPYHLYVFKKNGEFKALTFESFSTALSDNPAALEKFRQLFPRHKIPMFSEKGNFNNLTSVVDLYNQ